MNTLATDSEGRRPSLDCVQPAAAFRPAACCGRGWQGKPSSPNPPYPPGSRAASSQSGSRLRQSKVLLALALAFVLATPLHAQDVTQNVTLVNGWNSVWLEVEPRYAVGDTVLNDPALPGDDETLAAGDARLAQRKAPQDVFTDTKITVAVTPKPLLGGVELFAANPDAGGTIGVFNQAEWQQWKRSDPPGSNNLPSIGGNRPYLVKVEGATGNFNLAVSGRARFSRPTWTPDRYNLLGFGIQGNLSFDTFFATAGTTHPVSRIYSLDPAGNWTTVAGGSLIKDDVAYWIFCDGISDFMGPVSVDFDLAGLGTLNFGGPSDAVSVDPIPNTIELDLEELVFTNRSGADVDPELELMAADPLQGASDFLLHVVNPLPGSFAYTTGNNVDATINDGASTLGETVDAQSTGVISIGAERNWISGRVGRTNVYRLIVGDPGIKLWLPISALNNSAQLPEDTLAVSPEGLVAGLWVGEVTVDAVTSAVEDGAPVRPAAGSAPIRVLLHSDDSGKVTLLNQVTIMQTKTADPDVVPDPVLVVDPRRIPFFEGIKERNGKRVGLRLQSVAYDMPRDIKISVQSDTPVSLSNCSLTSGLTTVTCDATAGLERRMSVRGPGISKGTTVASIQNGITFVLSAPAVATNAAASLEASSDLIDVIVSESTSPVTNWASGQNLYDERSDVDEAAIASYLLFRPIRPPTLKESYHLGLSISGALGSGKTVRTNPGTLTLDPFHRTNPFRHAFSQRHPRGPAITRELTIVFDPAQGIAGRLRGSYSETITGLTKSTLELSGRVHLQRVSSVDTLDTATVPAP